MATQCPESLLPANGVMSRVRHAVFVGFYGIAYAVAVYVILLVALGTDRTWVLPQSSPGEPTVQASPQDSLKAREFLRQRDSVIAAFDAFAQLHPGVMPDSIDQLACEGYARCPARMAGDRVAVVVDDWWWLATPSIENHALTVACETYLVPPSLSGGCRILDERSVRERVADAGRCAAPRSAVRRLICDSPDLLREENELKRRVDNGISVSEPPRQQQWAQLYRHFLDDRQVRCVDAGCIAAQNAVFASWLNRWDAVGPMMPGPGLHDIALDPVSRGQFARFLEVSPDRPVARKVDDFREHPDSPVIALEAFEKSAYLTWVNSQLEPGAAVNEVSSFEDMVFAAQRGVGMLSLYLAAGVQAPVADTHPTGLRVGAPHRPWFEGATPDEWARDAHVLNVSRAAARFEEAHAMFPAFADEVGCEPRECRLNPAQATMTVAFEGDRWRVMVPPMTMMGVDCLRESRVPRPGGAPCRASLVDPVPDLVTSFDCRHASTMVEKRLCANDALAAADRDLAAAWTRALSGRKADDRTSMVMQQNEFIALRERECSDDNCIERMTRERQLTLEPTAWFLPDNYRRGCYQKVPASLYHVFARLTHRLDHAWKASAAGVADDVSDADSQAFAEWLGRTTGIDWVVYSPRSGGTLIIDREDCQ